MRSLDPAMRVALPGAIVLYVALSLADFGFTLAAFMMGAAEANPALRWFESQGLFEFAKLSFTLLVCCTAFRVWHVKHVPRVMAWANVVMTIVLAYHIALCMHIAR